MPYVTLRSCIIVLYIRKLSTSFVHDNLELAEAYAFHAVLFILSSSDSPLSTVINNVLFDCYGL